MTSITLNFKAAVYREMDSKLVLQIIMTISSLILTGCPIFVALYCIKLSLVNINTILFGTLVYLIVNLPTDFKFPAVVICTNALRKAKIFQ